MGEEVEFGSLDVQFLIIHRLGTEACEVNGRDLKRTGEIERDDGGVGLEGSEPCARKKFAEPQAGEADVAADIEDAWVEAASSVSSASSNSTKLVPMAPS